MRLGRLFGKIVTRALLLCSNSQSLRTSESAKDVFRSKMAPRTSVAVEAPVTSALLNSSSPAAVKSTSGSHSTPSDSITKNKKSSNSSLQDSKDTASESTHSKPSKHHKET